MAKIRIAAALLILLGALAYWALESYQPLCGQGWWLWHERCYVPAGFSINLERLSIVILDGGEPCTIENVGDRDG